MYYFLKRLEFVYAHRLSSLPEIADPRSESGLARNVIARKKIDFDGLKREMVSDLLLHINSGYIKLLL